MLYVVSAQSMFNTVSLIFLACYLPDLFTSCRLWKVILVSNTEIIHVESIHMGLVKILNPFPLSSITMIRKIKR